MSDEEINDFDTKGFNIFNKEEEENDNHNPYKYVKNEKVYFEVKNEILIETEKKLENNTIKNCNIKQNDFFCQYNEEITEKITKKENKEIEEFIKNESFYDFYFDDEFNIPEEYLYKLVKNKIEILNSENDKLQNDNEELKNILKNKSYNYIDESFKSFLNNLNEVNIVNNPFSCEICNGQNNFEELYAYDDELKKKNECFHKSCYIELFGEIPENTYKIIDWKNTENFHILKKSILNKKDNILKNIFSQFFKDCENKFEKKYLKIEKRELYIIDKKAFNQNIEQFKISTLKEILNN